MYHDDLRRIQFHIEDELDEAAATEAARRGISKAELIREALRGVIDPLGDPMDDPIARLIGDIDEEPADIDTVVYGLDRPLNDVADAG